MQCILMNKNTEILVAEYQPSLAVFTKITEVKNIAYAPLILKKSYNQNDEEKFIVELSKWFKGRGIPSWRDKLDILLARLNLSTPEELLDKAFGLSLSDQYWIKPIDSDIKYEDINFFDHDFDSAEFLEATFSNSSRSITSEDSLKTPNNTTDGMLKKSWIIENGKRYLLKGGYKNDIMQPFNEVLASRICERLGFNHVTYTLDIVKEKVVSKCECFINKDTELVTAYQIMYGIEKNQDSKDYEEYIKILEDNGIENVREKLENMYILDFLILNEDRHLNNFGIIRDVNNLKWLDIAPIFDNGQSFNIVDLDQAELMVNVDGRFFYNIDEFDNIITIVKDLSRIDTSKLDGIVEEFDELLHEYQNITGISDERIHKLCVLLNRQIKKLNKLINIKGNK
ncbi:MAG: HipA domain-containing protein [Erysipelotrichaceae bacterium]|nr:HipA domain-containing protein [Erysipelotrichaceae bacterium]